MKAHSHSITVHVVIMVLFLLWITVSYALLCLIYNIGVITGEYGDNKTVHSGCVFSTLSGVHWGSSGMKVGALHCFLSHPFRSKTINN